MSKSQAKSAAEQIQADIAAVEEEELTVLLEGTVGEVQEEIAKIESIDRLRDLATAEMEGKNRKGVLSAIGPRIEELVPSEEVAPPATDGSEAPADLELKAPDLAEEAKEDEPPAPAPEPVAETERLPVSMAYPFEEDPWEGALGRYVAIKHMTRIMNPLGGLDDRIKTPQKVNEEIETDWFSKGYELINVMPMGFDQTGLAVMYVLGKVREDIEPIHNQIWHIQRTLVERTQQTNSITAFQADGYLTSFLRDGWNLFAAEVIARGGTEIPMLWVLVR